MRVNLNFYIRLGLEYVKMKHHKSYFTHRPTRWQKIHCFLIYQVNTILQKHRVDSASCCRSLCEGQFGSYVRYIHSVFTYVGQTNCNSYSEITRPFLRKVERICGFYRVSHNSLSRVIKSVHSNGGKDCDMRLIDGKRNSPDLFRTPHNCCVCPHFVTRQMSSR
jgi:hypothetical protein